MHMCAFIDIASQWAFTSASLCITLLAISRPYATLLAHIIHPVTKGRRVFTR